MIIRHVFVAEAKGAICLINKKKFDTLKISLGHASASLSRRVHENISGDIMTVQKETSIVSKNR